MVATDLRGKLLKKAIVSPFFLLPRDRASHLPVNVRHIFTLCSKNSRIVLVRIVLNQ